MASTKMKISDGAPIFTITAENQAILDTVVAELQEVFAGSCDRIDMRRAGQFLYALAIWILWLIVFVVLCFILLAAIMVLCALLCMAITSVVDAIRDAWTTKRSRVKGDQDLELSREGLRAISEVESDLELSGDEVRATGEADSDLEEDVEK